MESWTRSPFAGILLGLVLVLATLVADCRFAPHARGQAAHAEMTPALALARICWSEEGHALTDGCAVLHGVIERVAQIARVDYVEAARRYSGRIFDPDRRDERRYIAHLLPVHAIARRGAPPYWPETWSRRRRVRGALMVEIIPHAPWIAFRARWAAMLAHTPKIISGEIRHACPEPPEHWGCPDCGDRELREGSPGWRRIDCNDTRNELPPPANDVWVVDAVPARAPAPTP